MLRFALPWAWGCGIIAALWSLEHYKSLAGRAEAVDVAPPIVDEAAPARMRLIMYVHPHCPCTRASLIEMQHLVSGVKDRGRAVATEIVVVVPPGLDDTWRDGMITRAAEQFEGATVRYDLDAAEAREVGATTSGHTVLVDAAGRHLFRGGLTRSRGHAGDNAGSRAVGELLHDRKPESTATPVFGCPLYAAEACRSADECRAAKTMKSESTKPVSSPSPIAPSPAAQD